MNFIWKILGLPRQIEMLLIILIGCGFLICDKSLLFLKPNLDEVWSYPLNVQVWPIDLQIYVKYILCGLILIRALTLHLFLALYIVMLWPAVFEDRPNLMLPWILLGLLRSIAANFVALVTGCYLCVTSKGLHLICLDFFISQIIDKGPVVYAWLSVTGFYFHLKSILEEDSDSIVKDDTTLAERRRRTRCLNFDDKADDGRNLISGSTIESLVHYLKVKLSVASSRSLDSLLSLKAAEEEKEEIMSVYDDTSTEDEGSYTVSERAMKLLNIVYEDVNRAKREQDGRSLRIISELTLEANQNQDGNKQVGSTLSSESFFIKNGRNFKGKGLYNLQDENHLRVLSNVPHMESLEESSEAALNEIELGNLILGTKHLEEVLKRQHKLPEEYDFLQNENSLSESSSEDNLIS